VPFFQRQLNEVVSATFSRFGVAGWFEVQSPHSKEIGREEVLFRKRSSDFCAKRKRPGGEGKLGFSEASYCLWRSTFGWHERARRQALERDGERTAEGAAGRAGLLVRYKCVERLYQKAQLQVLRHWWKGARCRAATVDSTGWASIAGGERRLTWLPAFGKAPHAIRTAP
jgi:hypothetical protein